MKASCHTFSVDKLHYLLTSKFSDRGSCVQGTCSDTNRTHPVSTWYVLVSCGWGRTLIFRVGGIMTVPIKRPTMTPATTQCASSISLLTFHILSFHWWSRDGYIFNPGTKSKESQRDKDTRIRDDDCSRSGYVLPYHISRILEDLKGCQNAEHIHKGQQNGTRCLCCAQQ